MFKISLRPAVVDANKIKSFKRQSKNTDRDVSGLEYRAAATWTKTKIVFSRTTLADRLIYRVIVLLKNVYKPLSYLSICHCLSRTVA